ncbi:hypothetical protein EJK54_0838 [Moraxella catarrhalis]|uniref:Uncharacterized protein n=1 Tax=Moraxella catarrhalis TaxID=480 RepID=A0ABY0BK45_MORCA|nr:hypothetical protein EJK54_0838 [Moraxella catarrhalis]
MIKIKNPMKIGNKTYRPNVVIVSADTKNSVAIADIPSTFMIIYPHIIAIFIPTTNHQVRISTIFL